MRIAVCIKQVPDTTSVRIDPSTNILMREGVESVTNPFDLFALEQALVLKDTLGAEVTVISMGPPQAEEVLRDALARGADRACLVSSRAFGGADTLATAYTLAQALRTLYADSLPDLVLFGQQAVDGDTAQVGPGVSACLDIPLVTYVRALQVQPATMSYLATAVFDDGERTVEGQFPAVVTVCKDALPARFASLAGTMKARNLKIDVLDEKAICAEAARLGLAGSPTKVVSVNPPPVKKRGRIEPWRGDIHGLLAAIGEAAGRKAAS